MPVFVSAYADAIAKSMEEYQEEAACLAKEGNLEKAQVVLNKKKLVEKEVRGHSHCVEVGV